MAVIHEVAKAAGVSIATVSRAFSNAGAVRPTTRERIMKAAAELNYTPHSAARNLRRRQQRKSALSYSVGLLHNPDFFCRSAFDLKFASHLEQALRCYGFSLRLLRCPRRAEEIASILDAELDACVCLPAEPVVQDLGKQLPTVLAGQYFPSSGVYGIVPDYQSGICEATSLLLDSGHRRIVVFAEMGERPIPFDFGTLVRNGFLSAHEGKGTLPMDAAMVGGANTPESGYDVCLRALELQPDAIIASDSAMLGIYKVLSERGLKVGTDVSVIGIDGMPETAFLCPALTTLNVGIDAMAHRAADVISETVRSGIVRQGMELMPTALVHRDSVIGGKQADS